MARNLIGILMYKGFGLCKELADTEIFIEKKNQFKEIIADFIVSTNLEASSS
jgi:hypothetical protein